MRGIVAGGVVFVGRAGGAAPPCDLEVRWVK